MYPMSMKRAERIRNSLGYSPTEMAKRLGMGLKSYQYFEQSGQSMRADVEAKLIALYKECHKKPSLDEWEKWTLEDASICVPETRGRRPYAKDIKPIKLKK